MAAAEASDQYASAAMTEKELADAANLARRRIASFAEAHGFEVVDPNKQIEDDAAEEQELPDPSALAAEPVDRPPTPPRRRSRSPAVSPSTDAGQISPQAFVKPKRLISRSFPSTTSTPDEFARQPPSEPFAPAALHPRSASRGASSSCSSSLPPPPPPSSHENPPTPPTHCWSGILTCLPWATTPEQPPAEPPPPEPPPPAPPPGPQLELLHASSLQTLEALEGTRTPSPAATLPLPAWAVAPGWPPSEAGATAVSDVSLAPQTPPRDPEDLPAAPMHVHLAAREAARLAVASGAAPVRWLPRRYLRRRARSRTARHHSSSSSPTPRYTKTRRPAPRRHLTSRHRSPRHTASSRTVARNALSTFVVPHRFRRICRESSLEPPTSASTRAPRRRNRRGAAAAATAAAVVAPSATAIWPHLLRDHPCARPPRTDPALPAEPSCPTG